MHLRIAAALIIAATPFLTASVVLQCGACRDLAIFHDELREDTAWHEVPLRAGQHYLIDATPQRGVAAVELFELDGDLRTACTSVGARQRCAVTVGRDATLGILVDSSLASSHTLVEVRAVD